MKRILFFVLVLLLLVPTSVLAQETMSFEKWEDLIPYIELLESRIKVLESGNIQGVTQSTWDGSNIISAENSNAVGNFQIAINKFEIKQGRKGDILVIYFQFDNTSNETSDFSDINKTAFQNGIEIDTDYDFNKDSSTKIRPGASIEVAYGFLLMDTVSPVELELDEYFNWDSEPVLFVIDLAEASKE